MIYGIFLALTVLITNLILGIKLNKHLEMQIKGKPTITERTSTFSYINEEKSAAYIRR